MENSCWFHNWFNSPYYHQLYNNRNDKEAREFIHNLVKALEFKKQYKIWDIACGKGRHSICLAEHGMQVTGTDLAENNILQAKQHVTDNPEFLIHDMRTPFRVNYFDAVLNLFTSIGYFEDERDNLKVFKNIHSALKKNGVFVLDFFNAEFIKLHLLTETTEKRGDTIFHITKKINNNKVIKRIGFSDKGKNVHFEERVSLFDENYFREIAGHSGLEHVNTFGDYSLQPFDPEKSPRLIMTFKKI